MSWLFLACQGHRWAAHISFLRDCLDESNTFVSGANAWTLINFWINSIKIEWFSYCCCCCCYCWNKSGWYCESYFFLLIISAASRWFLTHFAVVCSWSCVHNSLSNRNTWTTSHLRIKVKCAPRIATITFFLTIKFTLSSWTRIALFRSTYTEKQQLFAAGNGPKYVPFNFASRKTFSTPLDSMFLLLRAFFIFSKHTEKPTDIFWIAPQITGAIVYWWQCLFKFYLFAKHNTLTIFVYIKFVSVLLVAFLLQCIHFIVFDIWSEGENSFKFHWLFCVCLCEPSDPLIKSNIFDVYKFIMLKGFVYAMSRFCGSNIFVWNFVI